MTGMRRRESALGSGLIDSLAVRKTSYVGLSSVFLALLGLTLNQSNVIMGVNLSIADPLAALLIAGAALTGSFWLPRAPVLFFVAVSVISISVSLFVTPLWLPSGVPAETIFKGYMKFVTCFGFFLLGVHLNRTGHAFTVLRCFALGAVIVSAAGVATFVGLNFPGSDELFLGGFRYKGLMNDPNYFAVLAVCALAFAWKDPYLPRYARNIACITLLSAVLLSGSKTGTLVLAAWFVWTFLRGVKRTGRSKAGFAQGLGILAVVTFGGAIAMVLLDATWSSRVAAAMEPIPALNRLTPLLTDFDAAIDQEGSGRGAAWDAGITLIKLSPIFGVGMGAYSEVAMAVAGEETLAHNTYLQLAAEWGIVLTGILFLWILVTLSKRYTTDNMKSWHAWLAAREALFVMLAGSLAISLNNARLFWLALGIVVGAVWVGGSSSEASPSRGRLPSRL